MARFLITSWPFPGHLYPQIAIAIALRARGHECAFYTGKRAAPVVEGEGFPYYPFHRVDEDAVYDTLFSPGRGSTEPAGAFEFAKLLRKWMLDTVPAQVEDLEVICAEWRPAAITSDPSMWGPILVLRELLGLPVAISSFVPGCMIPGPDAPPFGLGLPSPKRWKARLLANAVRLGQDLVARDFRRAAGEVRRRYGLAPLKTSVLAHTATVPLYLVPGAPEFDYNRRDLPPCVHYIGSCLWNRPQNAPPDEWLSSLPRERPWVHVTEGTVHVSAPLLLRAATEGLGNLPMEVIMTTGSGRDPKEMSLAPIASNIHIAKWISHSDLLPKTDVMVTTGGAGSVIAALTAEVPLVLVPTEWDKPEIAQRVVESGAGIRIAPKNCNAKTLRSAVERVLGDPSFRENACRLSKIFAGYGGADRAAVLLENLVD